MAFREKKKNKTKQKLRPHYMIKIRPFVFYFLLVHARFQFTSHPSMAKILLKWTAMLISEAKQRRNMAASSQWSRIAPLMTFKNKFRSAQPHGKSGDMHWKSDVISWKQKIQRKTWDGNVNRQCVYHNQSQYSKWSWNDHGEFHCKFLKRQIFLAVPC